MCLEPVQITPNNSWTLRTSLETRIPHHKESGYNANTKTVSTPREKLQDKLVLDRSKSQILKKEDATRYISSCVTLSDLAKDRFDLAETAKHLAQKAGEPREFEYFH